MRFPRPTQVEYSFPFVAPHEGRRVWGTRSYNQVSEEETAAAYAYKMDRPWLMPDEVRLEIRRGHALWVIGQGDEPVKVKLPSNDKMRVSEATASMNADGVLTVMIPKRHGPRRWYEYKDLVLAWFTTMPPDLQGKDGDGLRVRGGWAMAGGEGEGRDQVRMHLASDRRKGYSNGQGKVAKES
ncbi:hypothetical protein NL676_029035 [Syzygium grande]|nr:hypothetical protein NL676_029035 [Syzygium grande]